MASSRIDWRTRALLAALLVASKGCTAMHRMHLGVLERPDALTGEWVDVRHTAPGDTSLWVLRANGYDGAARLVVDASGVERRSEERYGSWYVRGDVADSMSRAICFAKRIGRDGATCISFSIDTVSAEGRQRRRLIVHSYRGQHYTGDRELLERSIPPAPANSTTNSR